MTSMPKSGKKKASTKKPSTENRGGDYFREAAEAIDKLRLTDVNLAKKRWKALKDSAASDTSGEGLPEIYDAGQIATSINHGIKTLTEQKIVLTSRQAFDYGQWRSEIRSELPPAFPTFGRSLKVKFHEIIGRLSHNFGTKKRPRYAITYAELLHLTKVPGINLVEELDQKLLARLEAL